MSKRYKQLLEKIDNTKSYGVTEACNTVKDLKSAKFDETVEIALNLNVDPRHADQMVRGAIVLPHGTGKTKKVLVLCTPDKEEEAKAAGADYVGLDEYVLKIQQGWTDIDVIIAAPNVMAQVGRVGRILGPRGLMPNPKSGTVTPNVGNAVKDVKGGKITFRVDKYGIIHSTVGRVSFSSDKLEENARELLTMVNKLKPSSAKGIYMQTLSVASTMSPGIKLDIKSIG